MGRVGALDGMVHADQGRYEECRRKNHIVRPAEELTTFILHVGHFVKIAPKKIPTDIHSYSGS